MKKVYLFNAGHEQEACYDSPSYTPPLRSVQLTKDFELLPLWFASASDKVLTTQSTNPFFQSLKVKGFQLPELIDDAELKQQKHEELEIITWGISSSVIARLKKRIGQKDNIKLPEWHPRLQQMNSRFFAFEMLTSLKNSGFLPPEIAIPQVFDNFDVLETYITEHLDQKLLIKLPYSSSGIGLLWIREGLERSERQILSGYLKRQRYVMLEFVYDKVLDFAFEFVRSDTGFNFCGISLFQTNEKGAYLGNFLLAQQEIENRIGRYVDLELLNTYKVVLSDLLTKATEGLDLSCIGIDMMIVKVGDRFVLHPCVEVNLRYNMGFLSVRFQQQHMNPTSKGVFKVDYADAESLASFVREQQEKYPLTLKDNRVVKGFINLTPVYSDTKYLAYALVDEVLSSSL